MFPDLLAKHAREPGAPGDCDHDSSMRTSRLCGMRERPKKANRTIFMGADFEVDLRSGGAMTWSGPGKDGKPMRYVTGEVLRVEPPKLFEYKFGMADGKVMSRVKVELTPETEAVKVVVTNDGFEEDDQAYAQNADGWPRILSRLKTLLETGKTFRPH